MLHMPSLKRSHASMAEWVNSREHVGRARRVKINMSVILELASGCKVKATIDDLSRDGFRLRSESVLHLGQTLTMHSPRETVLCELRWVDGHEAGGVFQQQAEPPKW